jgi:hypothetical protein
MMQGSLGGLVSGESVWFPPTTWGVWLIEGISGNGLACVTRIVLPVDESGDRRQQSLH